MATRHRHDVRWTDSETLDLLDPETGERHGSMVDCGDVGWRWTCHQCWDAHGIAVDEAAAWSGFLFHEKSHP